MQSKDKLLLNVVTDGSTSISNLLLANYSKIGLQEQEMMLIIHLLYFQSKGNFFPSITELEQRMSYSTEEIMKLLQRLVRQGYIFIEEFDDYGKISEKYNLLPIFLKVISLEERNFEVSAIEKDTKNNEAKISNIFKSFEQEFGRPLSPMEIELINTWLDKDKYSDEIIIYALKESVYANKLNFRYIDRILFEWQKKNVKTVEQVKEHIKKFRSVQEVTKGTRPTKDTGSFEFYNWLENE